MLLEREDALNPKTIKYCPDRGKFLTTQLPVANISKSAWWTFEGSTAILKANEQGGMAMSLGERIYKLRTEREMSQGDLADALEVSRQSISKWETNGSVPELDKLVKLSEIFDVSLDELVTGKEQEKKPETVVEEPTPAEPKFEPQIIYVEKQVRPTLTPAQILGIILIACSILSFLILDDLFEALALCFPVAIGGTLCLVTKHPLLWCSWCGSVTWWVYMFILAHRGKSQTLFLIIGSLLVGAALAYTIYLHKKEGIHIPVWGWALLILVLVLAGTLLAIKLIPPSFGVVEHSTPAIPVPDASIVPGG